MDTLEYALQLIIEYDGWEEWLKEIVEEMKKLNETEGDCHYSIDFELEELHTEPHVIWMLLVGMFGMWGTSIRHGWIEKENFNACIEFIEKMIPEEDDD